MQEQRFGLIKTLDCLSCIVTDRNNTELFIAPLVNGFYEIVIVKPSEKIKKMYVGDLWHVRQDHPNHEDVRRTLKSCDTQVSRSHSDKCEICLASGLCKKRHSKKYKKVDETERFEAKCAFQKVVVDTMDLTKAGLHEE